MEATWLKFHQKGSSLSSSPPCQIAIYLQKREEERYLIKIFTFFLFLFPFPRSTAGTEKRIKRRKVEEGSRTSHAFILSERGGIFLLIGHELHEFPTF